MYRKMLLPGIVLVGVLIIGTTGYWIIGHKDYQLIDALYMTVITITTIGYTEIIDLTGNTAGKVFTIFVAISGIGALGYIVTNFTALVVDGQITKSFRRMRMEKRAMNVTDHYIVCGIGTLGYPIINELHTTLKPYVVVEANTSIMEKCMDIWPDGIYIEGDATDNDTLIKAGIKNAKGIFAITNDDNINLVISITAKQLNPKIRVVTQCKEIKNSEKMKTAGADSVVSTSHISGMRMVSEMIRPTVVTFLDMMLRDTNKNLRVEEISIPPSLIGKKIADVDLSKYPNTLILAVKVREDWDYNPPRDYIIQPDSVFVVMTTPAEQSKLRKKLAI
jgi:voltage-gated potassium channel